MKLSVKNIGKLESAEIDISGITVVAGENNTGKSTIGKALFSVFNAFHDPDRQVKSNKVRSIAMALAPLRRASDVGLDWYSLGDRVARKIVCHGGSSEHILTALISSEFEESGFKVDDDSLAEAVSLIGERLAVPDEEALKACMTKWFEIEFGSQINNIYLEKPGTVSLEIRGEMSEIEIKDDQVCNMSRVFHLGTSAIYLDDPFAIDEPMGFRRPIRESAVGHRESLQQLLSEQNGNQSIFDEIVVSDKLSAVEGIVNRVCAGDVVQRGYRLGYVEPGAAAPLQAKNLSAGMKTFAIMKRLLKNGSIRENGTIILDEPEVHLHPEWQLVFAELIVLLQKNFGMHILLTTHSPYFLNAIEVYSSKYGVDKQCRYYLAKNTKEGMARVSDITGDLEQAYSLLARPFQVLEDELYE